MRPDRAKPHPATGWCSVYLKPMRAKVRAGLSGRQGAGSRRARAREAPRGQHPRSLPISCLPCWDLEDPWLQALAVLRTPFRWVALGDGLGWFLPQHRAAWRDGRSPVGGPRWRLRPERLPSHSWCVAFEELVRGVKAAAALGAAQPPCPLGISAGRPLPVTASSIQTDPTAPPSQDHPLPQPEPLLPVPLGSHSGRFCSGPFSLRRSTLPGLLPPPGLLPTPCLSLPGGEGGALTSLPASVSLAAKAALSPIPGVRLDDQLALRL